VVVILGINLKTVNCKMTWEGTYSFTYEVDYGGGGICNSTAVRSLHVRNLAQSTLITRSSQCTLESAPLLLRQ